MSNVEYSICRDVIVTCRVCGMFDCKIVKGLCGKHYRKQYRLDHPEIVRERERRNQLKKDPGREKQRKAESYQKNKERWLAQCKENRIKNKHQISERRRLKRLNTPSDLLASRRRQDYEKNKDKRLAQAKEYAARNKEKIAEMKRQYLAINAEQIRASRAEKRRAGLMKMEDKRHKAARRAKKKIAGGSHTAADIRNLMILQKGKCAICRCDIKSSFHLDHVVPLALGGSNDKFNLQLLCPPCNQLKHARDPIDHMQSLGFLL